VKILRSLEYGWTFVIDPASAASKFKMRTGMHCTEYILMHDQGHVRTGMEVLYIYRE
jgi:hypothetical protein